MNYKNCIPHIDVFLDNGYTKEEEKMINETRKILGRPNLRITATTVRVPVLNSHSEVINVEFERDFRLKELKQILKQSSGIILRDDYPTTLDSNNQDNVFIGRISSRLFYIEILVFYSFSNIIVTGPSFCNETCISAANLPVATFLIFCFLHCSTKYS